MIISKIDSFLIFFQSIAWPLVIYLIFRYFAGPLKILLSSFNQAVTERGIKLTSSGVEIPAPQDDSEKIFDIAQKPYHFSQTLKQNKPEVLEEPLISIQDTEGSVTEQHTQGLIDELYIFFDEFLASNKSDKKVEDVLKDLLCDSYICLYFERTYYHILPTQLKILSMLASQANRRLEKKKIYEFFETHVSLNYTLPFEKWINYLIKSRLVNEGKNDIQISPEGTEFLKYIGDRGYSFTKNS